MFNIFKKDIKVGDKVKLYLTTGKEPEGTVVEIGDNFVLLQSDDQTQNRFFDKLIGGWDVIAKKVVVPVVPTKQFSKENLQYINLDDSITFKCFRCNKEKTSKKFAIYDNDENKKICNGCYGDILSPTQQTNSITRTNESNTTAQKQNNLPQINKDVILYRTKQLINSLNHTILNKVLEPNANIISVRGTTCIASNNQYPKILILNNTIIDSKIVSEIESFSVGSIIPIYATFYIDEKKREIRPTAIVSPDSIGYYLAIFMRFIEEERYIEAKRLSYILKNTLKGNKQLYAIINELKPITLEFQMAKIAVRNTENKEEKTAFKKIEKSINELIQNSEFKLAISKIDEELKSNQLDDRYKSSLLLKKAQTYSSLNNPTESEKAYQKLISFNEKTNPTAKNNLSHLYTELARLQALNPEKQNLALESVKKALKYNPNNNFASNLFNQFQGKSAIPKVEQTVDDESNLLVDADDDSTVISKMIDIDIREHKFTNPDILKNGGKPTAFIAKQIFETAKETRDIDLSERYPLYLEAAKAYSELNVGSYDLQDYLESVAYYAMLKGSSLYISFRHNVQDNRINLTELTRLKDSACSYYIESLNLLSTLSPNQLMTILSNYLKLSVVYYNIKNGRILKKNKNWFNTSFKNIFSNIMTDDTELVKIACEVIVNIGASSANAWNKLSLLPGGTSGLFDGKNKQIIYNSISEFEDITFDTSSVRPSDFLKKIFQQRKQKEKSFENTSLHIIEIELEPHNFEIIIAKWELLAKFWELLSTTDVETKEKIDEILSILKPYLNRNQTERTNLLIQSQRVIDSQIKFINSNTTFYGRTFFFPLLNKWKKEIDNLLGEKIAQSYPVLEIIIDPPYFVNKDGEKIVNVIIKNNGETTAEGYELAITAESTKYEDTQQQQTIIGNGEIPAGSRVDASFSILLSLLEDSDAVEIDMNIIAIYQKKKIAARNFQSTIEEEPKSSLMYDDILWKDGPIPEKILFRGREQIIADLAQHYNSVERDKPYILYGLTRTGKSSILKYLKEDIEGDIIMMKGKEMTLLTFSWDLSEAASFKKASDFWEYILFQQVYEELEKYAIQYGFNLSGLNLSQNPRAKDFQVILRFLQTKNLYPLFLVDEFSFIKTLIDGDIVNSAFLHTLRQYSLNELASFIFAGTYDIKSLIKEPKYGITGQLVNAIEEQINEIDDKYAKELIDVMGDKLIFTPEAISHIKSLSGNIPYFIQIICKYCGYYAAENKRQYIGYPELEKVVRILTGRDAASTKSLVKNLPENSFQNNQFGPADPPEVNVLISSIVYFNKDKINAPRGVGFDELQRLWSEKGVNAFRPKLAEAINLLKEKKILIQEEDEGLPVYRFAVDLFRRWWAVHHPDINLEITTIQ
jgi:hypothetical protein